MTVREVLKEALAVVTEAHCSTQLAVDALGSKVAPLDPSAAAWTSTGALIKVAPSGLPSPAAQHTEAAGDAYDLLTAVAEQQGYRNVASVDEAGREAAQKMFWRALQLVDDPPRRRGRTAPRAGAGASPKGAVA